MSRKDKYSLITDVHWYVNILLALTRIQGTKHGIEVAEQLIDISIRVISIRSYVVEKMISLLLDNSRYVLDGLLFGTINEVLRAAAWIVGEYSDILYHIASDNR